MAKPDQHGGICLPGEEGWELWKQGPTGMYLAQSMSLDEGGSPAAFKSAQILGYPVVSAFAVPVWTTTDDPAMMDGVVTLQLEKLGLNPDNSVGRLVDTKVAARNDGKVLAVASVLNETVAKELPQERPGGYEVTPYLYYLPDNHVVIWRELGRLVLCITRQEHPVYFHALTGGVLNADAVAEIESLMMPLYMQGIIGELEGIVLWTSQVEPGAENLLAKTLQLRLRHDKKPAPTNPVAPSSFEPTSVALQKIREAKMAKVRRIVAACLAVYFALVALLVGKYLWKKKTNDDLALEERRLRGQVGHVSRTLAEWEALKPVRDKRYFAIETLRRCFEPLMKYDQKLKITNVTVEADQIVVKGEAQNQPNANTYKNDLARAFPEFDWPNVVAFGPKRGGNETFTITGNIKRDDQGQPISPDLTLTSNTKPKNGGS